MKFTSEVVVTGMKASKGTMENGTAFDSTKVYVEVGMDESKGMQKGFASAEYTLGLAAEFDKYKHNTFPMKARAEFEIVTNGKTSKTVMHSMQPLELQKPPKVS
jgi:hypothetical protein